MSVVGIVGIVVLVLVAGYLVHLRPVAQAGGAPVGLVVRKLMPLQGEMHGPAAHWFDVAQGGVPAAVMNVRHLRFDKKTTYLAAWWDDSGGLWTYSLSAKRADFTFPIPITTGALSPVGTFTFVFGQWDNGDRRYVRVYARTTVQVVKLP